jgi:hypothetical protein
MEVYREELRTIEMVKVKQAEKIRELELELKNIKEKIAADEQEEQVHTLENSTLVLIHI